MINLNENPAVYNFEQVQRLVFLLYIFVFPCIQAYGLVNVKKSQDPLSKISKLDYIKMISINQKPTKLIEEIKI